MVIAGPTASGKTDLAIALSRELDAPILSADSRQVYRELNVGVAKPTPAQLAAAPHHLIGYVSIHDDYSAGRWARDAEGTLRACFAETRTCIIAGGSGLHVRALLEGLPEMPSVNAEVRQHYVSLFEREGLTALQTELVHRDPAYAKTVDMANAHRLQRALGAIASSGETFTALRARPRQPLPYRVHWVMLEPPRDRLYDRINRRVLRMFDAGLVEEARGLSPHRHLDALQTIGYRELWPYIDGAATLDQAIADLQQSTRRYARRQLTWNRRLSGLRIPAPDLEAVTAAIH